MEMMGSYMEAYLHQIITQLSEFTFLVALVSPLLGGEVAVLGLAFLAGQGTFSLWGVILGSFLGMLLLDMGWFLLMRFPITEGMKKWGESSVKYKEVERHVESFAHGNDVLVLFISKLLIGTRILILAYLSMRKITFSNFLLYDSIATFIWAVLLGYAGWASGRGYSNAISVYDTLLAQILYVLGFAVVCYAFIITFRQWILAR